MQDCDTHQDPCYGTLKVEADTDYLYDKLQMFESVISGINLDHLPQTITNKIIQDALDKERDPSGYNRCHHKNVFGKAGPAGFNRSYTKCN
ncbi:MAG: hypothetical protein AB8B67_04960 [Rickettsiaceae bacterium]